MAYRSKASWSVVFAVGRDAQRETQAPYIQTIQQTTGIMVDLVSMMVHYANPIPDVFLSTTTKLNPLYNRSIQVMKWSKDGRMDSPEWIGSEDDVQSIFIPPHVPVYWAILNRTENAVTLQSNSETNPELIEFGSQTDNCIRAQIGAVQLRSSFEDTRWGIERVNVPRINDILN